MTTKTDYADDEWARLRRAPFVAGMAISIADPGGPIELTKETMATLKAASSPPTQDELLVSVSQEILAMVKQKQNPLSEFKPDRSALAGKMILDELGAVNVILDAKATAAEADAFRRWLVAVATAAADAAKEGGFMGFGAVQVSEGEQRMMDELRACSACLRPESTRLSSTLSRRSARCTVQFLGVDVVAMATYCWRSPRCEGACHEGSVANRRRGDPDREPGADRVADRCPDHADVDGHARYEPGRRAASSRSREVVSIRRNSRTSAKRSTTVLRARTIAAGPLDRRS